MPTHAEHRRLPYSDEQLFDLVADVERYPEFLPWCLAARVRSQQKLYFVIAAATLSFKSARACS